MKSTCIRIQQDLKPYLDGQLFAFRAYRIRRHLQSCSECKQELADIEAVGMELQRMSTEMIAESDSLDPGLRARILAAIPESGPQHSMPHTYFSRRRFIAVVGGLAAACAALMLLLPRRSQHEVMFSKRSAVATVSKPASVAIANSPLAGQPGAQVSSGARGDGVETELPVGSAARKSEVYLETSAGKRSYLSDGRPANLFTWSNPEKMKSAGPAAPSIGFANGPEVKATATGTSFAKHKVAANHEFHTFVTTSLSQGEAVVRQTTSSFNGKITAQYRPPDGTYVDVTAVLPARLVPDFVATIGQKTTSNTLVTSPTRNTAGSSPVNSNRHETRSSNDNTFSTNAGSINNSDNIGGGFGGSAGFKAQSVDKLSNASLDESVTIRIMLPQDHQSQRVPPAAGSSKNITN